MLSKIKRLLVYLYFRFWLKDSIRYHRYLGTKVGDDCRIFPYKFSSEPFLIEIGSRVTITAGVRLLTHDGSTWLFRDEKGRRQLYKPIKIGNNVFVGIDAILLPGVIVEDNVIIAAGSVVTKSIPANSIVAGNPAKIIGHYEDHLDRALKYYVSQEDLNESLPFKERIEAVVDEAVRPFLQK